MTTLKSNTHKALLVTAMTLAFTATAHSAAYIKYEGIKGESSAQQQPLVKSTGKTAQGMLLPAIQKVQQADTTQAPQMKKAPKRSSTSQAGGEHEIEYNVTSSK